MKSASLNRQRITAKQRAFIRELTTGKTVAQAMKSHKLTIDWMAQWLTNKEFRRRLNRLCRILGRLRELELTLAGRKSAELLHRAPTNKEVLSHASQTRAAESNVKLSRWGPAARRRKRASGASPSRSLAHPDLSSEQATDLLRSMNQPTETTEARDVESTSD